MNFKIFYSWQNDIDTKNNRSFIEDAIIKAKKQSHIFIEVDRDTKNTIGAQDITKIIFDKIDNCDMFIADVSLIGKYNKGTFFNKKVKRVVNSNVMIELGYAAAMIGWERIVCIFNEDYGKIEDLPFDLRQHRMLTYSLKGKDKKDEKLRLIKQLSDIISDILKEGNSKKKGFAFECLLGFDFINVTTHKEIVSYNFANWCKNIVDYYKKEIIDLYNKLSSFKITEIKNEQNQVINSSLFAKGVTIKPFNVEFVLQNLKAYLNIDVTEEYFSFGNLTESLIPTSLTSRSLSGTNDEKNKYYTYNQMYFLLKVYIALLKIINKYENYKVIPLVVYNDSQISDSNVDIALSIDKNSQILSLNEILTNNDINDLKLLLEYDVFNKIFYLYEVRSEIKNEYEPYIYDKEDMFGNTIEPNKSDIIEALDNVLISFNDNGDNLEFEFTLSELKANTKKWIPKLILVSNDDNLSIKYKVRSIKSNGNIEGILEYKHSISKKI